MIETRSGLGFAAETSERFAGIGVVTKDALYGDDATGMALSRAIDHAHPATANLFENLVIAEPPVLVGQIYFGENPNERFRITFILRIEPGFEQTADTESTRYVR
jgi:hypothetical protein